jgi:hypothetical protein
VAEGWEPVLGASLFRQRQTAPNLIRALLLVDGSPPDFTRPRSTHKPHGMQEVWGSNPHSST